MLYDIPKPTPPVKNPTPDIADKTYKHSVVDSSKTPIETIAAYIGGSNLLTDYYSQQYGRSEELKPFDPYALNVYQSYHKIHQFIIKLQGALSPEDENSTGRYQLTGSAIIPPIPELIPNYGDAFIADIGEGKAGQFTVTGVRKLTANLASAWNIEFKMDREVDKELIQALDSKVVKESYFQRDYLITGQKALLATDDFVASGKLKEWLKKIARQYMANNWSHEGSTISIPYQLEPAYDPYVVRAVLSILSAEDSPLISKMVAYNCDDYSMPSYDDVYSAAIKRDPTLLYTAFRSAVLLRVNARRVSALHNSIRYSSFKKYMVPNTRHPGNDYYSTLELLVLANSPMNRLSSTDPYQEASNPCGCPPVDKIDPPDLTTELGVALSKIPRVGNDSYVLSSGFYDKNLEGLTLFERMVWKVIDDEPIEYSVVYDFCKYFHLWGKLEQFYLGPLLLLMIKHCLTKI